MVFVPLVPVGFATISEMAGQTQALGEERAFVCGHVAWLDEEYGLQRLFRDGLQTPGFVASIPGCCKGVTCLECFRFRSFRSFRSFRFQMISDFYDFF